MLVLCIVGLYQACVADEVKIVPSISVKEEYTDNILYSITDTTNDFITTLSPGLSYIRNTERMQLDLSGRADRRIYACHSELDATDQYYDGRFQYSFTERLKATGTAHYSEDSQPDRDLATTGFAFTGVTRKRQNYEVSSEYFLSEILMARGTYTYQNDLYDNIRYPDMEQHQFNLGFVHDLSYFMQKTQARMNIGYARYNIPDFKVDNYECTAGINRALNEKFNLLVDAGVRHTRSRYNYQDFMFVPPFIVYRHDSNEDWGGVGQLALTYKGEASSGELKVNHDIMPASGRSGATERSAFVMGMKVRISYELMFAFSAGYFINKSKSGQYSVQNIDEDSVWVNPSLVYDYSKDVSISFSYTYNRIHYNLDNNNAERNLFQIRYRLQHEFLP